MKKIRFLSLLLSLILTFSVATPLCGAADDGALQSRTVHLGDADGNGVVDTDDLILLRQYFANKDYNTGECHVSISDNADIDRDDEITVKDLFALRKYLVDGVYPTDSLKIVENGYSASVTTSGGLKYTASGYDGVSDAGLIFAKDMSIVFDEPFEASFNRFTVSYSSATALKIFVSYTEDGTVKEDYFFLESGRGIFSGLILNFLDGKQGSDITGIRIENLEDKDAELAIFEFSSEIVSVPDREYYIRGNRYTLGIDLGWGGTINYVSDNLCPVDGVGNMINKHDTGRLVQQSYYGTGEKEGIDFEYGSFNGSAMWPYNPVQGGGQKNTASRLVDFVVTNDSVYIKVQPMDWGKSDIKYITPSYMENRYIIEDDYIRVDNRFVDFSGWEHPCRGQELPAFYTIGYLDSFVWYDGIEPWSGDELSWRHELRFWGDSNYSGECSFRIKEPNSETWCAWVSTEDNYGIGLYSPNIDRYSAGRYQYIETLGVSTGTKGSKDPSANPTSYVAPWKQIQLVSFEALEYSYLICAGSVDEIRGTFTEYKDLFDNSSLNKNSENARQPYFDEMMENIDFTIEGNEKFACYPNSTGVSYDKDVEALKLTVEGSDPHVTLDYNASTYVLKSEDYRYIEITYMIPTTNSRGSYVCQLFVGTGTRTGAAEEYSTRANLIKDGNFHTLRVKVEGANYWDGIINTIRFDYFGSGGVGDVLYVRSIRFSNEDISGMEKIDLSNADGMTLFSNANCTTVEFDKTENATKLTNSGKDPYFIVDYSLNATTLKAEDYSKLRITYMVPEGQSRGNFSYAVFPCTGDVTSPSSSVQIYKTTGIIADGEYHTLEIDLSAYDFWTGNINKIRFDYFNDANIGDYFYITAFELVK